MNQIPESLTEEYPRGFQSWQDFKYFVNALAKSSEFTKAPVQKYRSNVGFTEHWYFHQPTGRTYRLIEPDGPMRGLWVIVPQEELSGGQT